ncbi:hypothetical protein Tco_0242908 [Tanacetum coccineum]
MKRLIRSEKERLEVRRNVRSRKTIRSETTIRREKKHLGVRRIVNRREETIIIETRCMRDVRIKYWEKSICPTTLLPPKHHVHVGRQRKKRQRSKHKDEPFVKDGKLRQKMKNLYMFNLQETLDTIRPSAKDKVERQQPVVISPSSYKCVFDLNIMEQLTRIFFNVGGNNAEAGGLSAAAGEGGAGGPGSAVFHQGHPIVDGQREEYKQKN